VCTTQSRDCVNSQIARNILICSSPGLKLNIVSLCISSASPNVLYHCASAKGGVDTYFIDTSDLLRESPMLQSFELTCSNVLEIHRIILNFYLGWPRYCQML